MENSVKNCCNCHIPPRSRKLFSILNALESSEPAKRTGKEKSDEAVKKAGIVTHEVIFPAVN